MSAGNWCSKNSGASCMSVELLELEGKAGISRPLLLAHRMNERKVLLCPALPSVGLAPAC